MRQIADSAFPTQNADKVNSPKIHTRANRKLRLVLQRFLNARVTMLQRTKTETE